MQGGCYWATVQQSPGLAAPCARMQMRLFWQRLQGDDLMHKKLHASHSMLPCKTVICHAGKDACDQTGSG